MARSKSNHNEKDILKIISNNDSQRKHRDLEKELHLRFFSPEANPGETFTEFKKRILG